MVWNAMISDDNGQCFKKVLILAPLFDSEVVFDAKI